MMKPYALATGLLFAFAATPVLAQDTALISAGMKAIDKAEMADSPAMEKQDYLSTALLERVAIQVQADNDKQVAIFKDFHEHP